MYINPVKVHSERIIREDKKLAKDFDYDETDLPVQEKYFSKIEVKKKTFGLMCLVTEMGLFLSSFSFRSRIWKLNRIAALN